MNIKNNIKEFFIGFGKVMDHVPVLPKDINSPESICLFFSIQSQTELDRLDKLLRKTNFPSKNVMAFVLNRSESLSGVITNKYIFCFELDDFNLFGKKNEILNNRYSENHFDLLISFADTNDLVNQKLVSEINSSFKIGPENPQNSTIFDLIIDYKDTNDYAGYYNQVIHYLSALNIKMK